MLPGELIGTEEEYLPGKNTYVDKEGIHSTVVGDLHVDERRRATVIPKEHVPEVKVGSVVYGRVDEIFESVAFVALEFVETSDKKMRYTTMSGVLPVSEIKREYVRSIRDELRVGDIVKGVVVNITPFRVEISIRQNGMGVVKGFCTVCRHELTQKGNSLECPNCGHKETRKLSTI